MAPHLVERPICGLAISGWRGEGGGGGGGKREWSEWEGEMKRKKGRKKQKLGPVTPFAHRLQ